MVSSLGKGGAEKSSALLSVMLNNLGFDVHIVSILNDIDYHYSGKLLNLGELKDKDDSILGRYNRFKVFKKYLKSEKFDLIIDNRSRVQAYREFVISKFIYNVPTIYVIHNFKTDKAFTKYKWLNEFLYKNEIMTAVSNEAKEKFKNKFHLNRIETIYNAFDFETIVKQSKELSKGDIEFDKYIIFYGRIDDYHKNLKLLLKSFKESKLPENDYKLLLLGNGKDLMMIKDFVQHLELQNQVIFKTFEANPFPYVKHARFTVLSSRFEGFPMVIPETLSLETPMISVDCKSGPSEVIKHKFNGLLVENNNSHALANAMNSFIFDETLYQNCKSNARQSVENLSMQNIAKQWDKLLNS